MAMQKALVIQGTGEAKVVTDAPIPKAEKDFIKVKTVAVALNPSDWKHIDWRADQGAVVGFDYAGYVEEVGPEGKKPLKKGDRVAGFTHGCKYCAPDVHVLSKQEKRRIQAYLGKVTTDPEI